MLLKSMRRRGAPVAALTLSVFLSSALPTRLARADAPAPGQDADVTPSQHGVDGPHTVGEPSGGSGSADALITADPVTGAARATLAFELPQARGLPQPSLSLSYDSSSGMGLGGQPFQGLCHVGPSDPLPTLWDPSVVESRRVLSIVSDFVH
jgi:hypothetical protein